LIVIPAILLVHKSCSNPFIEQTSIMNWG